VLTVNQALRKNKIVIAQIHSKDQPGSNNYPLIKLQYHYLRGVGRLELLLRKRPGDAAVQNILLAENIQLNQRFSYELRVTPSGILGGNITSRHGDNGSFYQKLSGYWKHATALLQRRRLYSGQL
jgi:hypothetical protein